MLVRNKKVTATAQWEGRTLRNPSLQVQGLVLGDRHTCIRAGGGCSDRMERPLAVGI